jgi:hypothetical protein
MNGTNLNDAAWGSGPQYGAAWGSGPQNSAAWGS